MIDSTTHKPVKVSTSRGGWSHFIVPFAQLDKVVALFDANKVDYWVDDEVLSVDGGPEVAFINLEHGTDPVPVQRLLDSIP